MKSFKKREYNSLDGSFLKNHDVSKKHKTNVLTYENRAENELPINWHEVKIILDATVVEKYLNYRKSGGKISPSHRKKIVVQKIPRVNQDVFSENSNVMVKLEIPDDIGVDDNLSSEDSLVFADAPVKQEDCIPLLDSVDKNTVHNREFIEPLRDDFQCQDRDNFTAEAALKNEVVESESCYEETIIGQEFKDALKNEELFVGEEFKHEESIPSYGNVEPINQEDNNETIKKRTRPSRKRKCLDCDDCDHGSEKTSRVPSHNKLVMPKHPLQAPKKCSGKSQTLPKPSKSKSFLRTKHKKTKQESSTKPQPQKSEYRVYHCDHCDYKGHRTHLTRHLRNKHAYVFPDYSVRCSNCGEKFPSREEMRRHQSVCLLFWICKFCLVDVIPTKGAMRKHTKTMHPEKIYIEKGGKILDTVWAAKTMELTPFGQRYMEIRKFYLEIKSELIKFYCPKCAVTHDKIISRWAPRCDSCESRLLYQCQKCKGTQNYYPHIWRHLNKNIFCGIYVDLSLMEHEESSNAADQASSNEPKRHDCEICGFKGTTRTKLYEHVLRRHLDNGIIRNDWHTNSKCDASFGIGIERHRGFKDLCRIAARFPCRFCPTNCISTQHLSDHIAIMHFDELDGKDINEFLQEALDFTRMVKGVNLSRNKTADTGRDYHHNGIESMLKPVCIECKTDSAQESEDCAECQARLNFVCLRCDELFSKYSIAWVHATRMCENRSFTLTVGETRRNPAKHDASTSNKKLLCCHHCSFKNACKSILDYHIKYTHSRSQEIRSLFTCPKCYRSFDNADLLRQHKLRCRSGFYYTCNFCGQSSINFHVIEDHITSTHAEHVSCKDTLDEILQQVFDNKRAKTNPRFDEFGRRIRRTFLDNVKLTTFYCPNCDETVPQNFGYVTNTSRCPKCDGEMRAYCKVCNQVYFRWESIASHFKNTECGNAKIETCNLDHLYCRRQPPLEVTKNSVNYS